MKSTIAALAACLLLSLLVLLTPGLPGASAEGAGSGETPAHPYPYMDIADGNTGFVYSDEMLLGNSSVFSTDLVKASVVLADAGYDTKAVRMLRQMGYQNVVMLNDSQRTIDDNDKVAYTVGYKDVEGTNVRIWAVVIRGTRTNCEWFSDFNLGTGEESVTAGVHLGFDLAATEVEQQLRVRVPSTSGHAGKRCVFWFTGHSRGAAVANILAYRFTQVYGAANVFAYTFACPSVRKDADTSLTNIFNINNSGDMIPILPLEKWGYKRYGQTRTLCFAGYPEFINRKPGYQGARDTMAYQIILERMIPSEKEYYDGIRNFAVNFLAYKLGGCNEVTWDEFGAFYGPQVADEAIIYLIENETPLGLVDALIEQFSTVPDVIELIINTIELTKDMSEDEFAQYVYENGPTFRKIAHVTGVTISSIPGLEEAKVAALAIDTANTAWTAGEIIGCVLDLCDQTGDILDAIWHAHEPDSYVRWVNATYLGYMGRYDSSTTITMPTEYAGSLITTVGYGCFWNCGNLTTADFSEIAYVGGAAFMNCTSLESVTLPDDLYGLGDHAFSGCSLITEMTIPDSVQILGNGCLPTSLLTLTTPFIGSSRTANRTADAIMWYLFGMGADNSGNYDGRRYDESASESYYRHVSLQAITVTDQAIIPDFAFTQMETLESVTFAEGTEYLGACALHECAGLTTVSIPDTVTAMGEGLQFGDGVFYECVALESIALPSNITEIPDYAFARCYSLAGVTIHDGITRIGDCAFYDCGQITELIIPDSVQTLGEGCLPTSLITLTTPFIGSSRTANQTEDAVIWYLFGTNSYNGSYRRYNASESASYNSTSTLTDITVTDQADIPDFAFADLGCLERLTLAEGTVSLGTAALCNCRYLASVSLPDTLTTLGESEQFGDGLFYYCTALEEIILPPNLAEIPSHAFESCTALTGITIPDGVTRIGNYAFSGCSQITEMTIPDSVQSLGNSCLPTSLVTLTTPFIGSSRTANQTEDAVIWYLFGTTNNGTSRRYNASDYTSYNKTTTLTDITVTDQAHIPDFAFANLSCLERLTLAEGTISLGSAALCYCEYLTSVSFPDTLTTLGGTDQHGDGLFYYCMALEEIVLPPNLEEIPPYAFEYCTALARVAIPLSVTRIGDYAFIGCSALGVVYYPGYASQWDEIQIGAYNNPLMNALIRLYPTKILTLPASLRVIESEAFVNLPGVEAIRIPAGVESIDANAFDRTVILIIPADSDWVEWAENKGFYVIRE